MRYEVSSRSYSAAEVPTQIRSHDRVPPPPADWVAAPEFLPPELPLVESHSRSASASLLPAPRRPATEPASGFAAGSQGEISVSGRGTPVPQRKSSAPPERKSVGSVRVKAVPESVVDEAPSVVVSPQAHVPQPSARELLAAKLSAQLAEQLARTPGAPKLSPEQIHAFVQQQLAQQEAAQAAAAAAQAKQPQPPVYTPPAPLPQATLSRPSRSKSKSKSKSKSRSSRPSLTPAQGGSIDPLAVPLPPELAPTIFSWVRRLALQADLPSADRVLRDALGELTGSLNVSIVYPGNDGLFSLGPDEEIPRDMQPIIAVAQSRRAVISSHTALVPVITTSETIAVILLTRNARQSAYAPIEQLAMITLSRECAAIIHHLAVQHLQKASEIAADKGSLYRGEALEAHRNRGSEGVVANLSPGWVKRAYPVLVGAIVIAIVAAIFMRVPSYSTGMGVVMFEGATVVSAPAQGTVARALVVTGQPVKKGQVLVEMASSQEQTQFNEALSNRDDQLAQHLFDLTDAEPKKNLAKAEHELHASREHLAQRNIVAPRDGTVSDIRVLEGRALQMGEPVLTIAGDNERATVKVACPSKDVAKLHPGMEMQVELTGISKGREVADIIDVKQEAVSINDFARLVGPQLGDALKAPEMGGSFTIVTAAFRGNTFKTEHAEHFFRAGMLVTGEVKLTSKPFLATLIPSFEKYLPD